MHTDNTTTKKFPVEDFKKYLHLFFIDIINLSQTNNIQAFENREAGYTKAMLNAYNYAFNDSLTDGLSPEIICGIHAQALAHQPNCHPGQLKNSPNFFTVGLAELRTPDGRILQPINPNGSQQGFEEFLKFWFVDKQNPFHYIHFKPTNLSGQEVFLYPFNSKLKKGLSVIFQQRQFFGVTSKTEDYFPNATGFNKLFASLLTNTEYKCFINILENKLLPASGNRLSIQKLMKKELKDLCNSYNEAVSKAGTNDEQILRIIVQHVKLLNQLHPFADGNCRTFYILLNRLLAKNNLPLCLIIDPNRLEMLSTDEALEVVKKGQKDYLALMNNEKPSIVDTLNSTQLEIDIEPMELPASPPAIDSFVAIIEENLLSLKSNNDDQNSKIGTHIEPQFSFLHQLNSEQYHHERLMTKAKKLCGDNENFIPLLNAIDKKDYSLALRKASSVVNLPLLKLILSYQEKLKIDVNLPSSNGYTALDWVMKSNSPKKDIEEATAMLRKFEALSSDEITNKISITKADF
ncbi:Fic family protein [Legionella qingyii]|nr:Fic family protein [Legionella qingyii]